MISNNSKFVNLNSKVVRPSSGMFQTMGGVKNFSGRVGGKKLVDNITDEIQVDMF